nr:MAG TPA: hypothetical protein [Inoviridae sp.]
MLQPSFWLQCRKIMLYFSEQICYCPISGKDAKVRPVRSYEDRLRDGLKELR